MKAFALPLLALLATGCAGNGPYVEVERHEANIPVPPSASVRLDAAVGEIDVRGVDDETFAFKLVLSCRDGDNGCRRRAAKIRPAQRADTSAVGFSFEPGGMTAWRDVKARLDVTVPNDRALYLDIGAGDLIVHDMKNCVELDMYAGDATVRVARNVAGRVRLDVGTGDARLVVDDRRIDGERAWLVGAELDWADGIGWCEIFADLQFGDLTVELE